MTGVHGGRIALDSEIYRKYTTTVKAVELPQQNRGMGVI
jgi:hypothetical protein